MTSKRSRSIAADSNVLLAAIARRAALRVFRDAPELQVVTTAGNLAEVREYLPEFARKYQLTEAELEATLQLLRIEVVDDREFASKVAEATHYIAARDPDDVALAALALHREIPIWSNDRDYEDLPIEVYSTARLLKLLFP